MTVWTSRLTETKFVSGIRLVGSGVGEGGPLKETSRDTTETGCIGRKAAWMLESCIYIHKKKEPLYIYKFSPSRGGLTPLNKHPRLLSPLMAELPFGQLAHNAWPTRQGA